MKQKLWLFFLGVSCLGLQAQEKSMRLSLDEAIALPSKIVITPKPLKTEFPLQKKPLEKLPPLDCLS